MSNNSANPYVKAGFIGMGRVVPPAHSPPLGGQRAHRTRSTPNTAPPRSSSAPRPQPPSSLPLAGLSRPAHVASERQHQPSMPPRMPSRRPATESAALPSWRPTTDRAAAASDTSKAAAATRASSPALKGFREGWVSEPGPEPKRLQDLYKMRHLQALEMRKRQRQRASSAPREPRISRDELAKRAATRRAASPLGAVASVVVASPANGTKASPKPMVLPPPRGMVVVASPVRRTAAEIRAACARLSDHVMHTFGEKYLLNMRTTCASRYSSKITTIMRLQHVTAQLASKRESVSKLTMAGSELLASIVGCPTETVGELLPGSKLTKDNMANDSFVSACVRRRILLSHPDCWLPLNVDGYAELTVQLLETGANVRLQVRPTAKTELVYCCHPNARICVLNNSAATLEKRVRAGFVDHIREDGQSMVVFDSTDAAVAMDLRSPLVVSQAESLHRTAVKLSVEGTQVKLNLDIVLRPPQHMHVPTKLARKSTKSPQKSKHPSPARPASVPSLIIPLSAGHNRQPSPSEASEAGGQGEMEPGGGADQTAASEAERLAEGKTAEPSDGSSMQVAAISAEGEALALKLAQSQSDAPQSSDMQIIPLPSPIQSVSCKTLFDQLIRSFQGH